MTTQKDLLTAAYNGETPSQTPLSIYGRFFRDSRYPIENFRPLFDAGLGVTYCIDTVKTIQHGVTQRVYNETKGKYRYNYRTLETPIGNLESVTVTPLNPHPGLMDWVEQPWVKNPADYVVMQWIVENTEYIPAYDAYDIAEQALGNDGILVVAGIRSPAQRIQLEYTGTEKFCLDLALEVPELMDLYEVERKCLVAYNQLVAQGPGRWVMWAENLTIEILGPRRYEEYLLNVYDEIVPILEQNGKRAFVHYDGNLRVIKDQIAKAPFHMIESLTEPPEGDMLYDECRAAWPDKAIAGNINVACFDLPEDELRQTIIEKRARAGKQGFSFEISEDVPHNWRQTIPIVLDTLESIG